MQVTGSASTSPGDVHAEPGGPLNLQAPLFSPSNPVTLRRRLVWLNWKSCVPPTEPSPAPEAMNPPRILPRYFIGVLWILTAALTIERLPAQSSSHRGPSPAVSMTVPTSGSQLPAAPVTLEAVAVDPLGPPITQVEFLANGVVVAVSDRSGEVFPQVIGLEVTHQAVWYTPSSGVSVFKARALRDGQTIAQSKPVRVVVAPQKSLSESPIPPLIRTSPPEPKGVAMGCVATQ